MDSRVLRCDVGAIPFGEFPPAPFALSASDACLVPDELISLHELLGECFAPRPERPASSNVAYGSALHSGKTVHVRALIVSPIGRLGV